METRAILGDGIALQVMVYYKHLFNGMSLLEIL
jgi:hypothetical protein